MTPPRDPDQPPPRRGSGGLGCLKLFVILIAAGFGLLLLAAIGLYVASERGYFPPAEARRGDDLPERLANKLRTFAVEADEEILWFYSAALTDVHEDGNLLTDRRVVSYFEDFSTDEWFLNEIALEDIAGVEVTYESEWSLEDSLVDVYGDEDGDGEPEHVLSLYISSTEKRDAPFVRAIVDRARQAGAEIVTFEERGDERPARGQKR